jgi:hypothetical protein
MTDSERSDVLAAKLDALRELVDERDHRYEDRFTAMDEKTGLALTSSKEAVAKAETATEKRFDSVNEFRGQQKDMMASFASRVEMDARFKAIEEKSRWTMDKVIMLAVALAGWALLLWRGKP